MQSCLRRDNDNKENVCPEHNLTQRGHLCEKNKNSANNDYHAKFTGKQKSSRAKGDDKNCSAEVQKERSGSLYRCCCEPYCTCARNFHEAVQSKHTKRDDKDKNKTTHAVCDTYSPVEQPMQTQEATSKQRANEMREHEVELSTNKHIPLENSAAEGNYRVTNNKLSRLQQRELTHEQHYQEREEREPENLLLQNEEHTERLSSPRQMHERQQQQLSYRQKECTSKYGAMVNNNNYRRNVSELLRLRRNQAYRRSLEHEYNVRLDKLQDELNTRMHDLREEGKQNAKTRFMSDTSCHRGLPYGKLASKYNGQDSSATRKNVYPTAIVDPVKTTSTLPTNLSTVGKSHPYFAQPAVHESNKSKNKLKISKMNNNNNNNNCNNISGADCKDNRNSDNVNRSRELYAHTTVDTSGEMRYCRALQCCPCCGSALVALNISDTVNRLHDNLYSSLSECNCCGFVGAVRATCEQTQAIHSDDDDEDNNDNVECVKQEEDDNRYANEKHTRDITHNKELQSSYADHVNKTTITGMAPHMPSEKGNVCFNNESNLYNANSKQKAEEKAIRTVAHGLPIYKSRTSHRANVDKQAALETNSLMKSDKRANTTANETSVETASLCSPRFGRKTYITDEEYLFYRAQRLAAWEAEGCAERVNPPASVADDVYAPLPTRTPRWRIKCNTYLNQDNDNVMCTEHNKLEEHFESKTLHSYLYLKWRKNRTFVNRYNLYFTQHQPLQQQNSNNRTEERSIDNVISLSKRKLINIY